MNIVGKRVCAAVVVALCALHEGSSFTQSALQPAMAGTTPPLRTSTGLAFIEAPEFHSAVLAQRFPRGSRLVRLRLDAVGVPQGKPIPLSAGLFAAADPQVSFDGHKIIFAAQTERIATWQIFEVPSEGGVARQITHCAENCFQPFYLPENMIAYTALQGLSSDRASQVQISHADGAQSHPITFGPGNFEVETVLRSGRLLLSAESPLVASNGARQPRTLYVIDPDGSGLGLLRQDRFSAAQGSAEELADSTILFARQGTGQLVWISPGALHARTIARAGTGYASAHALGDGALVASRRVTNQQLDLYRVALNNFGHAQLIYRGTHTSSVQAVPIEPHPVEQAYRSILHPERTSGRIVCLDAYASKDVATGHFPRHIARVRVVTKAQNGEKVLGEAPVELDGSFYVTLPADLPIRLMLIGSNGEVMKQQRSWMWVRTGEDRGCFGCHESQAQAPENRSPMTLQRMDTPTLLLGDTATASARRKAARP